MQYKRLITILVIALIVLLPGGWSKAAYNDFVTDDTVIATLADFGIELHISSGANVEEMTVNTGNISITTAAGSTVTVSSPDRRSLVASFATQTFNCPNTGPSTLTITSAGAETSTITPSGSACAPSGTTSGGSGGGGGGVPSTPTVTTPSNLSLLIDAGVVETESHEVLLNISATNATNMMISNNEDFSGASWESYSSTKTWTLSSGIGTKTVYAKFKSSSGNQSAVISDSIEALPTTVAETIDKSAGGTVSLADSKVKVSVPRDTLTANGLISINPTSVYTAPSGTKKALGSRAYELKAEVGGANITTFINKLTLTFKYTDEEIKSLDEDSLAVYYWSEDQSKWVREGGTLDKENKTISVDVDHFTLFTILGEGLDVSGELVKLECDGTNQSICTAVYYVGNDGKRYVFPNEKIYFSWYDDYSAVKTITPSALATYQIGGNVTYRPGVKMVKIVSDPKVYAVSKNGVLKWVTTEAMAEALYGTEWNTKIDDLSDSFFFNYTIDGNITSSGDFNVATEKAASTSINEDKGLL